MFKNVRKNCCPKWRLFGSFKGNRPINVLFLLSLIHLKLTWADLYMTCMVDSVEQDIQGELLNNYPGLKKLQEKVNSIPTIATWRAKRPVTEF